MERRTVMMAAAAVAASLTLLPGCTTNKGASETPAQKMAAIDTGADATLATLYSSVPGSRELAAKSSGILVFPKIYAAGLGIGGEYGEGALKVGTTTVGYYKTSSLTWGFQAGAQSKALIMMFMTQEALDKFRNSSSGWTAGADASVAMMRTGANAAVDSATLQQAVIGYVITKGGLMANLSLEGTKVSPLEI